MGANLSRRREENRREEVVLDGRRVVVLTPVYPPPMSELDLGGGRLTFSLAPQPRVQLGYDLSPEGIRNALQVGLASVAVTFICYKVIRWYHNADGPPAEDALGEAPGGGGGGGGEGCEAPRGEGGGGPPADGAPGGV